MSVVIGLPIATSFVQQAALAFYERDALDVLATSFFYRDDGRLARLLRMVPEPLRSRAELQLRRRSIPALPVQAIETLSSLEIVRTILDRSGVGKITVDKFWDFMSRDFTRKVGCRADRPAVSALYLYEYTALEAFRMPCHEGRLKILDFPSLNSRQFQEILRREKTATPDLRNGYDAYFESVFEKRQARRDAEMAAADVVITNSTVTKASHVAGGADPNKTYSVPYGAPPALAAVGRRPDPSMPLRIVWAGSFSIRKGANYFLQAWARFNRGKGAHGDVFGRVVLPDTSKLDLPGLTFHGSVPRSVLFDAMERADVLLFPTLSDGFGMVVTEAFARGLPVITTKEAGASDLIANHENGLIIDAGSADAICNALQWCADNRLALSQMRDPALAAAKGWQWSDYRRGLAQAIVEGARKAGYDLGIEV